MKTPKFTKTATQLLYAKQAGDTLCTYRTRKNPEKREQAAIMFLLENGYIKFLRQYSYSDNNFGQGKTVEVVERHYEILKRPDWMGK
jgi:hypothetical protein